MSYFGVDLHKPLWTNKPTNTVRFIQSISERTRIMRRILFAEFHRYTSISTITSPFLALACLVASLASPGRVLGNEADRLWGSPTGVPVPNSSGGYSPGLFQHISDGSGGTFLAYAKYAGSVYAVRFNTAGQLLWGPVMLSATSAACYSARLTSDANGGALVAWVQDTGPSTSQIYVQRINANGSPIWSNPVAASTSSSIGRNLAVAPGGQGMFLVYQGSTGMAAAYTNTSGFLAPRASVASSWEPVVGILAGSRMSCPTARAAMASSSPGRAVRPGQSSPKMLCCPVAALSPRLGGPVRP